MLPGRSGQRKILRVYIGGGLLLAGIFMLPVPGLNLVGIVFIVIGLALIASGSGMSEFDAGGRLGGG
jgi:uncharacterized membrane protein HdeD (DUF308 family)